MPVSIHAPPPLVAASVSTNTRETYARALRQIDVWRDGQPITDTRLAGYLAALYDASRTPSRTATDRRRGQAPAFIADDLAAVLATCHRPRTFARGMESPPTAARRGRLDAAIAGLLFMAALRRSEVAALRWSDVTDAGDAAGGILIRVRTSKTDPAGDTPDVRYIKAGVARAVRSLRSTTTPEPSEPRGASDSPRDRPAVHRRRARRITAHSGRVGLASELTSRGASTTAVMLAGNWRIARMVAHYSAGDSMS